MHPLIPFILALRLSVRSFQMHLKRLSFAKRLATFGIIYATDPLLQSMTNKILFLRGLAFDIFNYKPLQTMLNYMRQFFKIRALSTGLTSETKPVTGNYFCISDASDSLSDCDKNQKKIYRLENFARTSLSFDQISICLIFNQYFTTSCITGIHQ